MLRGPKSFADAVGILDVLRAAHASSVYKHLSFDEKEANRVICQAIQRHGFKTPAGTFVQVSEVAGKIEGFIIGMLHSVYHCHLEMAATDLWWITTPQCPVRERVGLMMTMVDWARAHPRVVEITSSASDAMGGADKAARILEKLGFKPFGSIYRMEVQSA
jgi:hypothetical protein